MITAWATPLRSAVQSKEMLTSFQYSPLPTTLCLSRLPIDQLRQDQVKVPQAMQRHLFSIRQDVLTAHKPLAQVFVHVCDARGLEEDGELLAAVVLPLVVLAAGRLLLTGLPHTEFRSQLQALFGFLFRAE
jgi:hypothetical protein